ncbi:MAG: type II secretion system protein [Magnetococcales bacterium]|nr:type II secretion system protein [Magnetococcales bacterium]MBF0322515.1 type II secretion system protein [Magnetococcales bacterium]
MNTKKCRGFSLVEAIVVITVLGVLAGVAITNTGNVSPAAGDSVANSVAGAMVAAAANYRVRCEMGDLPVNFATVTNCTAARDLLQNVTLNDFTWGTGGGAPPTGYLYCTVRHSQGATTYTVTVRTTTASCG